MREKFELSCKIIGLVFWGFGLMTIVCSILIFILRPDVTHILPESGRAMYSQSQINELRTVTNYTTNRYVLIFAMMSVFEVIFGVYLMKSNNLFIKLCYPCDNQNIPVNPPSDIQLDVKSQGFQKKTGEPSENKYAPPGYYQK
ncbi:MAG: hypothetical protein JW787_03690 [Sedimentisphaerales bacterium]|nr:hypothetical protein [Sedimentisphaerales bacterium]